MSNWIKCSDRLPEEEVSVLVLQDGNDVCDYLVVQATLFESSWYADHEDGLICFNDRLHATYWQPLPTPPKGN